MTIDSGDAPPPPPPPPPPVDYSVVDEPVTDESAAAPDSAPAADVDTATGDGSAPDSLGDLSPADVPVVDEGQATPDDAAESRTAWEAVGDGSELPPSMREDFNQLGQDLRSDVDPDAWANADQDGRTAMLADANDRIRETYGLPPGDVNYSSQLPEGVTGKYSPSTGDITLDSSLLDDASPDEAINTLSHENFHDYQQQAINGNATDQYAQSRVDAWSAGQAGYDPQDFTAYMANPLEADAFAAERAVFDGYRRQ
jgi:hypothetical protein